MSRVAEQAEERGQDIGAASDRLHGLGRRGQDTEEGPAAEPRGHLARPMTPDPVQGRDGEHMQQHMVRWNIQALPPPSFASMTNDSTATGL